MRLPAFGRGGDCSRVAPQLRALIDGELTGREQNRVLSHVEGCFGCSREYERLQNLTSLLQACEMEDVPPSFVPDLQVRLRNRRRDVGRRKLSALGGRDGRVTGTRPVLVRGLAGVLAVGVVCALLLGRRLDASEIARRAAAAWNRVQSYGCVWLSTGTYQGTERRFYQRQFFRRPGEFRLDTSQDYPLETYVYEDRVLHYVPGAAWDGRGPIVILRPRHEAPRVLPFPFGVTWQGGNVSLDSLVRRLNLENPVLLGVERVGEHACFHLRLSSGFDRADMYDIWVDREVYLPRKVHWQRDPENSITTELQDLQLNYSILPAGTFDFRKPDGALLVRGDVDPHVLALPIRPPADSEAAADPVRGAAVQALDRSPRLPFPALSPAWIPEGYRLVRVRVRSGAWMDMHWIRVDGENADVVKLLVRGISGPVPEEHWSRVSRVIAGPAGPIPVHWRTETTPFEHVELAWQQGGARYRLSAAGLSVESALRLAGSLRPAAQLAAEREAPRPKGGSPVPSPVPEVLVQPESYEPVPEQQPAAQESPTGEMPPMMPVMMPEMADAD